MSKIFCQKRIPLCEPNLVGNERHNVAESIDSNWLSAGSFLNLFERQLADYTGAEHVIGISSGTTALQISMILAGVVLNDLILVPNLTFVATANAVKYVGADPVLIDIDPESWVLDLDLLTDFLENETYRSETNCYCKKTNRRVRAVVPVHLFGNMCDMDRLMEIANQYFLAVIEDAACALGSFQKGKHSGTFGLMGTLSFNSNKIITTAGGGAILTNDAALAKKARHLITQAKSGSLEYIHDMLGFNYRLVNPLAAIGVGQMEHLQQFVTRKREIAACYKRFFNKHAIQFQHIAPETFSNFWHPSILLKNSRKLIAFLAENNIESRPLWCPINELPFYKSATYITKNSSSKGVSERGIMLPCSTNISRDQLDTVCETVESFLNAET